ncbi:MAG TPA: hypothetical protein VH597_01460 [Verrucomicrobiae bacterium]|jgi:hypothetical protein|nr:hypothetical protein [Verrucomicrobiae bacterium]
MLQTFARRLVGNPFFKTRVFFVVGFYLAFSTVSALAQTTQALHWINDSSQNGFTTLNSTSNFITSFKGTNDVQITLISGKVNSIFQEAFAGLANNNNPGFLTNFIGLAANGTGDGTYGHINFLESTLNGEMVCGSLFPSP